MIETITFSRPAKISSAFKDWALAGFPITEKNKFNNRLEICKSCEFWNSESFNNTGGCKKCGCSTWAKLRMATERCPIGKWEAVSTESNAK